MSLILRLHGCSITFFNVASADWTQALRRTYKHFSDWASSPDPSLSCLWMSVYIASFPGSSYSNTGGNDKVWGHHEVIKYLKSWSILIYECTLRNIPPFSADHFNFPAKASWKRTIKVLSHWPWDWKPGRALIWRNRPLFIIVYDPQKVSSFPP